MKKRVLVLDDDPFLIRAMTRVLGRDFEVVTFLQGETALEALRQGGRYDAIVSDMDLGTMTGMDFYKEVVRLDPELGKRFLFHTGSPDAPATNVLTIAKPADANELRDTVWVLVS